MTAFVANTNLLELSGLHSVIQEGYVNTANVSVTLKSMAGVTMDIAGITWPLAMPYVEFSQGTYRAIIPHGAALTPHVPIVAHIDADAGDGSNDRFGHWEFVFTPEIRR